ncbi:MAG: HAD family hydrolase [Bacillota bacterium]
MDKRRLFKDVRTIFFDYDGCLHDSMAIYAPAFNRAYDFLVRTGKAEPREWRDDEISRWLGLNCIEMWEAFLPGADDDTRSQCMQIIKEAQKELIEQGRAVLYPGALEALSYLKGKGYRLVFISNCRKYYMDGHAKAFGLDAYFDELACSEGYGAVPKHEILRRVKERYPMDMAIVGDRALDMEAGRANGIHTIGCSYGFAREGELDGADAVISDITELKEYF